MNNNFKAEILADSLSPQGERLTTMKITFPRIVLAEFNTHRMFSRNSASSRAIPFKKMVKMVEEDPFIPIAWQKDHKGMQGTEYFTNSDDIHWNRNKWLAARDNATGSAKWLNAGFPEDASGIGVTKQLCNRLLEPFLWHTVIVSFTDIENFFKLRCPQYTILNEEKFKDKIFRSKKDLTKWEKENSFKYTHLHNTDLDWLRCNKSQAEIHIQAIAELMWDAYNESTPKQLQAGEWHIPFGDNIDSFKYGDKVKIRGVDERIKIATARCARISYETLGDNPKIDYEADIRLHDMLVSNGHASPLEHVAKAMSDEEYTDRFDKQEDGKLDLGWCRNFKGFIQYRHLVENNQRL